MMKKSVSPTSPAHIAAFWQQYFLRRRLGLRLSWGGCAVMLIVVNLGRASLPLTSHNWDVHEDVFEEEKELPLGWCFSCTHHFVGSDYGRDVAFPVHTYSCSFSSITGFHTYIFCGLLVLCCVTEELFPFFPTPLCLTLLTAFTFPSVCRDMNNNYLCLFVLPQTFQDV